MISFKLIDCGKLPERGKEGDAGLDICASEDVCILPHGAVKIRTGVVLADCPRGIYLRVAPRSKFGTASKTVLLADTVDENYRGEIAVSLMNTGSVAVNIRAGDKIAQLIPTHIIHYDVREVSEVTDSNRGASGIYDKDLRL